MQDSRDASFVGRSTDGRLIERPISPFMIPRDYRPQLTSVLSISSRISGVALVGGTVFAAAWLIALAGPGWQTMRAISRSIPGIVLLAGWTLALVYHTLAGLRHLLWDAGRGFTLRAAYRSGWATVIATVLLTAALLAAGILRFA